MRVISAMAMILVSSLSAALPAQAAPQNRCGWIVNPTPGNWWLTDKDGDWMMAMQGMDQDLPGMDLIPDLTEHDFVATNGAYGHACGCMKVDTQTDGDGKKISAIYSFKQLPIAKCSKDASLPKPE